MNHRVLNEGYVYFALHGVFDPNALSARLGITPTFFCLQWAKNPERGTPKTSQWQVSTERIVGDCIDVYELAEAIVTRLEPFTARIKDAITELGLLAFLEVVLYLSTDDEVSTPALGFSNRVLTFLANVNASIDIDTYLLPHDTSAATQASDE